MKMECNNLTTSCSPPKDYCSKCSHANYFGKVFVNDTQWAFTFNPQFGPLFVNLDGEPKKVQPAEHNPVWAKFQLWHDKNFNQ